jgi:quinohemoprotein ethanol dehydrogenase
MTNNKIYKTLLSTLFLCASIGLVACSGTSSETETKRADVVETLTIDAVDTAAILNAKNTPEVWLTYGGTYDEQRHARLNKITPDNVSEMGVAWTYPLSTSRGVEATPIVVDGVMYVTSAWSVVHALDAKTGKELWVYDPEVSGEDAAKGCCDVINRGVAVHGGKVYLGVFDGRLEALDAKTGEVVWSTLTVDKSRPYTITGAPRVVKGKVLIGNGGGELGVRGFVTAYDAETGEKVWRFYTVPNPDKKPDGEVSDDILAKLANDSWGETGGWVTDGGGGTAWDAIVYDEVNDSIIIGVGNGSPWNADIRDPESKGDNLFLSSILAVDADTGAYKWHFQTTPRDQWDYTATQTIILANLPVGEGGAKRRVVMQAPKNGFFYVLDAATGEYISGEKFEKNMTWATGLDATGRPIENPAARDTSGDGFVAIPAPFGAHNWHPMAFSPDTGLAYIPAQTMVQIIQDAPENTTKNPKWNLGYNLAAGVPPVYPAGTLDAVKATASGKLLAWDPVAQKEVWSVDHKSPMNGGVLSTSSGLVFQGKVDGEFAAYNAATGDKLWSQQVNSGIQAAPSTFEIDGEQYIAIATGWGSAWGVTFGALWEKAVAPDVGHVVVFKLGGTGEVPEFMGSMAERTPKAAVFGDDAQKALGFQRYNDNCMMCHGVLVMASGVTPDLRWSQISADAELWDEVVRGGSMSGTGMVAFDEQLTREESEAIRAHVLDQAWLAVKNGDAKAPAN